MSALRLAEKGYRVGVVEMGKRWRAEDFPKTTWNVWRWIWRPGLGLKGFYNMRPFKHVVVLCGNAVGGGSITYANTLLSPPATVWSEGSWQGPRRLGGRDAGALRDREADARRGRESDPRRCGSRAEADGREPGHRRHVLQDRRRRVLRRWAGQEASGSVLRWRRSGAIRMHRLRWLHGRLPLRREKYARPELPLSRREARREDPRRDPRHASWCRATADATATTCTSSAALHACSSNAACCARVTSCSRHRRSARWTC